MGIRDKISGIFKKTNAQAFVEIKDGEIEAVGKLLKEAVERSEKDLDVEGIEEVREMANNIPLVVEIVLDKILSNLLDKELEAIDKQIEQDKEDSIESPRIADLKGSIEDIREKKMDPDKIKKSYNEIDIVDMGQLIGAKTDIRLRKLENAELLHEAIFKG